MPWAGTATSSTRPDCLKPHPAWSWSLPGMRQPQLLWAGCSVSHHISALLCTHSSRSLSFICWSPRAGPNSGGRGPQEQLGRATSLGLLAMVLLLQPRTLLAFEAAKESFKHSLAVQELSASSAANEVINSCLHCFWYPLGWIEPTFRTMFLSGELVRTLEFLAEAGTQWSRRREVILGGKGKKPAECGEVLTHWRRGVRRHAGQDCLNPVTSGFSSLKIVLSTALTDIYNLKPGPLCFSCKEYKNLNSFFAIIMGLSNVAVSRLSLTWEVSRC